MVGAITVRFKIIGYLLMVAVACWALGVCAQHSFADDSQFIGPVDLLSAAGNSDTTLNSGNSGTIVMTSGSTLTVSGSITSTGNYSIFNGGTLNVHSPITTSGIGAVSAIGSTLNFNDNGAIILGALGRNIFPGPVFLDLSTPNTSGSITSNENTYTGTTILNSGTLNVNSGYSGSTVVSNGGVLNLTNGYSGGLTILSNNPRTTGEVALVNSAGLSNFSLVSQPYTVVNQVNLINGTIFGSNFPSLTSVGYTLVNGGNLALNTGSDTSSVDEADAGLPNAAPEPAGVILAGCGLAALVLARRRLRISR
jgi:hypothetical protein